MTGEDVAEVVREVLDEPLGFRDQRAGQRGEDADEDEQSDHSDEEGRQAAPPAMTDQPAHRRVQSDGEQDRHQHPDEDLTDIVDEEERQPESSCDEENNERAPGRDASARRGR